MSSKSIEDLKKNISECTGYQCKHETSEKHWIIDDKDILDIYGAGREYGEELIIRRLKNQIEKLEGKESFCSYDNMAGYQGALDEVSKLLK